MSGALSHIRVLDLSRILAGPTTTQVLADLGAEVIKIERPEVGDDTRLWVPPVLRNERGEDTGEAAYYACVNRNKKSVTVDISKPAGQDIIRRLAAKSDVMIENYLVGTLKRYDLDYDSLKAINPRLVYCSVTGFGQTGPYAARAGYDPIMQAMSGLMSVTGERDEKPGGGPQRVGISISDLLTGAYSAIGILAALQYRERSGRGQYIDTALFDCMIAGLSNVAMNYLATGEVPPRLGNENPLRVPANTYQTRDDLWLAIMVHSEDQWEPFCRAVGGEEWRDDPRFQTMLLRVNNRAAMNEVVAQRVAEQPADHWMQRLEAERIPYALVNNYMQALKDPQVAHRGIVHEVDHPRSGRIRLVGPPWVMSGVRTEIREPHLLGQHTEMVLHAWLGMTPKEVASLISADTDSLQSASASP